MGSYAAASTDAHIVGVLRGIGDLSPKPLATKLRELQAANGRLELTSARLQQGDLVANAAGAVSLNPRGALNGEINVTVINFGKLLQVLGVDRMIAQAVPQATIDKLAPGLDRVMPGLGGLLRGNTGAASGGAAASLGAAAVGGKSTELDGQRAIIDDAAPLRRHRLSRPAQGRTNPAAVLSRRPHVKPVIARLDRAIQ